MTDCPNCAAKDAAIAELVKALRASPQVLTVFQPVTTPTYYDRCPCNPKNGGSGICNCTMGGARITCGGAP